ncbi:BPSS1780 family membrane protein [Rhodoferax sp. UBA5149]|uniref:BPSS1780 family membrane protein n=1 Tax=Rhodoferax sp. UBA5149 TaxID=1947379 RepID=UPI0025DEE6E5|nr:BPSS1780 family membrane protein [Rhodoferax sp. UBA5149]
MKLNIVPARTGMLWVKLGIRTFFRQPLALAGLFFMFMAVMTVASQIPFIGTALAMALLPAATLGLMVATREATDGRFPMPFVLLAAFRAGRQQARAMLVLGALYALGFLLAMGASWLMDGGSFASVYLGGVTPTREMMVEPAFQAAMWIFIGLHLPLSLMFWHAPALVHWHGLPPVKSLFFSLVACFRNFWAFALFGVMWLAVLVLVVAGVTTLAALLGKPELAGDFLFPVLLLTASMFFTSLYFTFRDSFEPPPEAAPGTTPQAAP